MLLLLLASRHKALQLAARLAALGAGLADPRVTRRLVELLRDPFIGPLGACRRGARCSRCSSRPAIPARPRSSSRRSRSVRRRCARLVHADHLLETGDPRGELIDACSYASVLVRDGEEALGHPLWGDRASRSFAIGDRVTAEVDGLAPLEIELFAKEQARAHARSPAPGRPLHAARRKRRDRGEAPGAPRLHGRPRARGILFGSGPFLGGAFGEGMTILRAASAEAARAILDRDPFVIAGLRTYELREWILKGGAITVTLHASEQRGSLP